METMDDTNIDVFRKYSDVKFYVSKVNLIYVLLRWIRD
jgi:hypothetical protein